MSPPSLTTQIQQLEKSLGVTLLDRNTRKVMLTQAGEELLVPLEGILKDMESVMSSAHDVPGIKNAVVTVAAVPSVAAGLFPHALRHFCRKYPTVSVHLKDSTGDFIDVVKRGEVDFGVGSLFQEDFSINVETLYREPICIFAHKGHLQAQRRTISFKELVTHPLILPEKNSDLRRSLDRAFEEHGLSLQPFHETSHLSTTIGMVNAGLGIAVLPLRAFDCFHSPGVRCVRIVNPVLKRRVVIFTKVGRSLPAAAKRYD